MTHMWRSSAAIVAIICMLFQASSSAIADDVGVPIYPLPSNSGVEAEANSTASKSFDWTIQTFDPHDAATVQFHREPLGATSGAGPNSASGREESENRIDLLSLAFGVVILGIIGLAILNADNSGSPV